MGCIRLMLEGAGAHQLKLTDWNWGNVGFRYGGGPVLLDWPGTKKSSETAYQRCKTAWTSFVAEMMRQVPPTQEWKDFWGADAVLFGQDMVA